MITSRIFGGLGNQLFQYATARALALRNSTSLRLDTRLCTPGNHWAYGLDHFDIQAEIAVPDALPPDKSQPLRYAIWRYLGGRPRFLREKGLGYSVEIAQWKGEAYLHGYFQSEQYFKDVADQIRRELVVKTPPSDENKRWLDHIAQGTSVSLHVRRGDYLAAKGSHAVCDAAYYARAVACIAERTGADLKVFIFSDSPDWAEENIELPFEKHVMRHNGSDKHYEDIRLMSACRHHIIANSTFSWWGAWLNARSETITIAPQTWFGTEKLSNPDIIPARWVQM